MVVYHGSLNDISTFASSDFFGSGYFGKGINLTSSAQDESKYASKDVGVNHDLGSKASVMAEKMLMDYKEAKELLTSGNGTVYPLFSSMKNPLSIDSAQLFVPEKVLRTALSELTIKTIQMYLSVSLIGQGMELSSSNLCKIDEQQ